ncbi:hypothetical protein OIU34_22650 [Pararhizobium sp. BT-229]|uniref:hypothetical protein n=1 Tax=Pararhizobium sp. BT-229 TaxID=2986923 RepID=UPI0021F6EB7C|nr:hypothetical protein [Pararhizobium sp. BT-229]MCV9964694.1 hypothetical protein [Pararhizobium sp. BT-229]
MSDENEWALSFNPRTQEDLDVDALKEALAPYVVSVTRKSEHRYELILDDELPDSPVMGEVITNVILMLGELYPDGVVVGHVDNEPEY